MKNGKNSLHYEVTVSKVNLRSGNMKAKAKKKKKTGLRASTGTVESSFFKQKSTQLERIVKILNRMIVLLSIASLYTDEQEVEDVYMRVKNSMEVGHFISYRYLRQEVEGFCFGGWLVIGVATTIPPAPAGLVNNFLKPGSCRALHLDLIGRDPGFISGDKCSFFLSLIPFTPLIFLF